MNSWTNSCKTTRQLREAHDEQLDQMRKDSLSEKEYEFQEFDGTSDHATKQAVQSGALLYCNEKMKNLNADSTLLLHGFIAHVLLGEFVEWQHQGMEERKQKWI